MKTEAEEEKPEEEKPTKKRKRKSKWPPTEDDPIEGRWEARMKRRKAEESENPGAEPQKRRLHEFINEEAMERIKKKMKEREERERVVAVQVTRWGCE